MIFKQIKVMLTWNMEAPYGVRQAFSKLSLPVDTNHLPHVAKRNDSTHDSCRCSWYLSGLRACNTSTLEFSMPTANHSPVGQYPNENICAVNIKKNSECYNTVTCKYRYTVQVGIGKKRM